MGITDVAIVTLELQYRNNGSCCSDFLSRSKWFTLYIYTLISIKFRIAILLFTKN